MKSLRVTLLTAGLLALGGCTVFSSFSEVEALNNTEAVGSLFTQALANEYRQFANVELNEMFDYPDALHFARKGLAAAAGETVLPEPITDWNLNEQHQKTLSTQRGRLIIAFDLGARETSPSLTAHAQAKFDCWIEQQEENWQEEDIMACKKQFLEAMDQLEASIQPVPQPVAEVVEPTISPFDVDASQPMAAENAMYLVFFNWDSADLGAGALNVLDAVAEEVSKNPPTSLNVIGHADTSGPKRYNQRLALKRANTVKNALVKRGVSATLLKVDAKGETEPLVPTPDGVREPANRRVNISFDDGNYL